MLNRIVEGCETLFRKYGIKSLSMDDIARELGMSKRTIYQFVNDKNDLVLKTFSHILSNHKSRCNEIHKEIKNPVLEILEFTKEMSSQMKETHPAIFFDLRKYHPDAWQMFNGFSQEFIFQHIKDNLKKGIETGHYRNDLDVNIIPQLYICLIQNITNPECFSNIEYNFNTIYSEMIRYHFYGICTAKGLKFIDTKE
ncbi:MAG: TetR/AcrR family transcriptional regulator [Flavobacteriales bacterium]|nr:TetR/AcrR family transcriptional regulator [Flavobacteriales bacterium]